MLYFSQLANALVIGTLYALMSLGLSLIFGVLKLVNFAHGEFLMMGGYIYFLLTTLGLPLPLALALSMPILFGVGLAIERVFLQDPYKKKMARYDEYVILVTFALGLFIQNLALPIFGPYNRQAPPLLKGSVQVGELIIGADRLTGALMAFLVIGGLIFFLYRTYSGKGLRAVAQSPAAAAIVGIKVLRMRSVAFGLGITLAGVAGALFGPIFLVNPEMGTSFAVKAFVIVVLGGMGSIRGSIIGGYLLAMVESFGSILLLDPSRALAYKDAYGLLLLVFILLVRPQGLFGEKERRA
jgi:branched-chain amino acid transport system permease protein